MTRKLTNNYRSDDGFMICHALVLNVLYRLCPQGADVRLLPDRKRAILGVGGRNMGRNLASRVEKKSQRPVFFILEISRSAV